MPAASESSTLLGLSLIALPSPTIRRFTAFCFMVLVIVSDSCRGLGIHWALRVIHVAAPSRGVVAQATVTVVGRGRLPGVPPCPLPVTLVTASAVASDPKVRRGEVGEDTVSPENPTSSADTQRTLIET